MTYLIQVGLALLLQVIWEEVGFASTPRWWLLVAFAFVPHGLWFVAHRCYLRGRFRLAERTYRALHWSPVWLQAAALFAADWIEILEGLTGSSASLVGWPSLALLPAFAPFAVYSLIAIDARARLMGGARSHAGLRFQARLFAAAFVPLIGYVVIASLVGALDDLRLSIETVAVWNALYAVVMLALFAISLPWVLCNTWETEPLPPGPERALLDAVSERAKFDGRRLFLWHTNFSMANAAIVGLLPAYRTVIFSDLLLSQLNLRQLASVYAHEIGHAKRGHVPIFAAWAFAALFGADLAASALVEGEPVGTALILAASVGIWFLGFGWMSRRFELEADLFSLRLCGDAAPLIAALEQVSGPHARSRTSWRHFSTERRIEFLEEAQRDGQQAARLERRLFWVGRIGIVAFLAIMAMEARGLLGQWPRDQVLLDLRRGAYASAAERMAQLTDEDPALGALVRRAAAVGEISLAELAERARRALVAGEFEAANQWLDLGALRGDSDMARVQGVLAAAHLQPGSDTADLLRDIPDSWRSVLEPLLRPGPR